MTITVEKHQIRGEADKTTLVFKNDENSKELTIDINGKPDDVKLDDYVDNGKMTDTATNLFKTRLNSRKDELNAFLAPKKVKQADEKPLEKPEEPKDKAPTATGYSKTAKDWTNFGFGLTPAILAGLVAYKQATPEFALGVVSKLPGALSDRIQVVQGVVAAALTFGATFFASKRSLPYISSKVAVYKLASVVSATGIAHVLAGDNRISLAAAALASAYMYGTQAKDFAIEQKEEFLANKLAYFQSRTTKLALPTLAAATAYAFNSNIASLVSKGSEVAANYTGFNFAVPALAVLAPVAAAFVGSLANGVVASKYTAMTTLSDEKTREKGAVDSNKLFKQRCEKVALPAVKALAFAASAFVVSSNLVESTMIKGLAAVAVAAASVAPEIATVAGLTK